MVNEIANPLRREALLYQERRANWRKKGDAFYMRPIAATTHATLLCQDTTVRARHNFALSVI